MRRDAAFKDVASLGATNARSRRCPAAH